MNVHGKTVLITGGSRGIGRAIALEFAKAGADIAITSRTKSALLSVAKEIEAIRGKALIVPGDVSNPKDVEHVVGKMLDEWGTIDVLINNAAIHDPKSVIDTTLDDWNTTLTTNLTSSFLYCRAVLPGMIKRKKGKIINISSGAGSRGFPGNAAYSASKGGLNAFSQALAGEVREYGITVNVVSPGHIHTDLHGMNSGNNPLIVEEDFMTIADVTTTALFLASDCTNINAQIFHVRNTDRW